MTEENIEGPDSNISFFLSLSWCSFVGEFKKFNLKKMHV